MLALGLIVAVPATVLVADDDEADQPPPAPFPIAQGSPSTPALGTGGHDRGLDISYRVPSGWREKKQASAVRLRSGDRSAEIVIAAPAPASEAESVLDEALAAIRDGYRKVEVAPGSGREVGGLDARGAVVTATTGGVELRILVAVATGRGRTYLVEVFTTAAIPAARLREAQIALNSLRLGT
jgi:hypothetical protein